MTRGEAEQVRAGLFVLIGLVVFAVAVVLLGKKSALFSRTDTLFVSFSEVNGLAVGAPVRLAGLEIGSVEAISFPDDLRNKRARLRLVVRSAYMSRIRADSRAFIDSNGLLGDKIINISLGDPAAPPLYDGATLEAGPTTSFEALASTLSETITSMNKVVGDVRSIVGELDQSRTQDDVKRITSSLAAILSEVASGQGTLHQLIYDPRYAHELDQTLARAYSVAQRADTAVLRVDRVLAEVEQGDGGMHQLLYGPAAADAAGEFASAAREIAEVVREIRVGDGLAHGLIYADGETHVMADLEQLSSTLNRIVQEIDQGRGTLGALIKDPTVYEDLKTTLGNVQRNVLFKALIRATIERDQLRRADRAPRTRASDAPSR